MKFLRRAVEDVADTQLVTLQRTRDNKYLRFNVEGPDELRNGFPRRSRSYSPTAVSFWVLSRQAHSL